jgi:thiol-disulfide isomerase/thioredoxin
MKKGILLLFILFLSFSLFAAQKKFNSCGNIVLNNVDNSQSKFSDFTGGKLLVVFWSPRCSHCVNEIPVLKRLKKEYNDKLTIISILEIGYDNFVKDFLEKNKLPYPVFKMNYKLENCLGGVRYFPTLYFLNADGKIKNKLESYNEYEVIKNIIDSL